MLTADLVRARRQGDELRVSRLKGKQRDRALELSQALRGAAQATVGQTREELKEAWGKIETLARERRLMDGLSKLLEDDCEFAIPEASDPAELRREVFSRASAARREVGPGEVFDRQQVLAAVAAQRGLSPEGIDNALYADLRSAHLGGTELAGLALKGVDLRGVHLEGTDLRGIEF